MPGVTFVRIGSAHRDDHRKPATMHAAMSRWTLPEMISNETGRNSSDGSASRPSSHHSTAKFSAVHAATKTCHDTNVNGATSCAKAGEYR